LSLDPPIHECGRCFLTQVGCRGVPAVAVGDGGPPDVAGEGGVLVVARPGDPLAP
jgi:hypothetical protein